VGIRRTGFLLLLAAAPWVLPGTAAAEPYAPYDGSNPFNCVIQDVGTGTDFPAPGADPFCVEFDKTSQNVTDFGLADFLAQEPARVAAAGPKCFYYQHDHWTGSVVQGGQPELWHWDGSYFFDKARGVGGVFVTNFRIGGQASDPRPYAPPDMRPYMNEAGGGVLTSGEVEADPACARRVDSHLERRFVYYHRIRGGKIHRKRIAPIRLRTLRRMVIRRLGPAHQRAPHTDRWDVAGGGQLRLGWRGTALDRRVAALFTTSPSHFRGRLRPGAPAAVARKLRARPYRRIEGFSVLEAPPRKRSRMLVGLAGGKVAWVAVADPRRVGARGLHRVLRRLLAEPPA
jgi:hypothetical protein